jgi:hypothetical protein
MKEGDEDVLLIIPLLFGLLPWGRLGLCRRRDRRIKRERPTGSALAENFANEIFLFATDFCLIRLNSPPLLDRQFLSSCRPSGVNFQFHTHTNNRKFCKLAGRICGLHTELQNTSTSAKISAVSTYSM